MKNRTHFSKGVSTGTALGIILGLQIDNIAIGLTIGICLGFAIGAIADARSRQQDQKAEVLSPNNKDSGPKSDH